jgi:hypothetical protein
MISFVIAFLGYKKIVDVLTALLWCNTTQFVLRIILNKSKFGMQQAGCSENYFM